MKNTTISALGISHNAAILRTTGDSGALVPFLSLLGRVWRSSASLAASGRGSDRLWSAPAGSLQLSATRARLTPSLESAGVRTATQGIPDRLDGAEPAEPMRRDRHTWRAPDRRLAPAAGSGAVSRALLAPNAS